MNQISWDLKRELIKILLKSEITAILHCSTIVAKLVLTCSLCWEGAPPNFSTVSVCQSAECLCGDRVVVCLSLLRRVIVLLLRCPVPVSNFYFQRKKRKKMGACCTKFGTYLLRKEENKVVSNGGTPRLNRVEHKQSFVASPEANGRTRSASSSSSSSSSSSGSKS